MSAPKYSIQEIERRWLVEAARAEPLLHDSPARITDRYLDDTRLRLRRVQEADGALVFKFCRKYGDREGPSESITNLYLDPGEYAMLRRLPATEVIKERHRLDQGAIDVYRSDERQLHIFEIEFRDLEAAMGYLPPRFAGREVTGDPAYTGLSLARQFG